MLTDLKKKAPKIQTAHQPLHREAFPKLDIVAAKTAFDRHGDSVCVYTQGNRIIGQLLLVDLLNNAVTLEYTIGCEHIPHSHGLVNVVTSEAANTVDRFRRSMLCPVCTRLRFSLYFKSFWACGDCHQLLYRSQLVDSLTRLWERRDELHQVIQRGRPKGMHNRTYEQLSRELTALEAKLAGKPRTYASDAHRLVIESRWVPASEVELWSTAYTVSAGRIVKSASH